MRSIITIVLLVLVNVSFGQNKAKVDFKKNEVKVNALYFILGALEVNYERLLNEESGVGISVATLVDTDSSLSSAVVISPYYRFYFGQKPASGFYFEGFSQYSNLKYKTYTFFTNQTQTEQINTFALGVALGGKWYTKRGIVFEIGGGIGRNLVANSNFQNSEPSRITGKFSISAGYRF